MTECLLRFLIGNLNYKPLQIMAFLVYLRYHYYFHFVAQTFRSFTFRFKLYQYNVKHKINNIIKQLRAKNIEIILIIFNVFVDYIGFIKLIDTNNPDINPPI